MSILKYKRILLKLSGEALLGKRTHGIDPEVADYIAKEIKGLTQIGVEIAVVFGGGNIFRWRSNKDSGIDRASADSIGFLGTVMNSLAFSSFLNNIDVENVILSAVEMPKICEHYTASKAKKYLIEKSVVLSAGGTGNPFFTSDTAAALRACELECDAVFKATKVDGVYDKDPHRHEDAKKFHSLNYLDVLNNKYEVMDNTAVTLCMDNNIPIVVFELLEKGNIEKAVLGQKIGTIIQN